MNPLLPDAAAKAKRYLAALYWLTVDSVWRFKLRVLLILGAGVLGVVCKVGAIGQAIYYARALEKGRTIGLLGYELAARSSVALLVLFALGILVSLLFSAILIYISSGGVLKLARQYEEMCSMRIFRTFGNSQWMWHRAGEKFPSEKSLLALSTADARCCGRVFRNLLNVIVPAITFVVASAALLILDVPLSLGVFALMFISTFFLYVTNSRVARHAGLFEKYSKESRRERRALFGDLMGSTLPRWTDGSWFKPTFQSGATKLYLDAFVGRILGVQVSHLINNVFVAFGICAILLLLGYRAITQRHGWERIAVYLVALRYAASNLRNVCASATTLNRFYPMWMRYYQYMKDTPTLPPADKQEVPSEFEIAAVAGPLTGSMDRWTLHPGHRLGLISQLPLQRNTLQHILGSTLAVGEADLRAIVARTWFVSACSTSPPVTVRQYLSLREGNNLDALEGLLGNLECWGQLKDQLPKDLDALFPPDAWRAMPPDVRAVFMIAGALGSECRYVVIDGDVLSKISETDGSCILDKLSDRILVIFHHGSVDKLGRFGEEIAAVISPSGVIALGETDWLLSNRDKLAGLLASADNQGADDEDEVDDDLDE